MCEDGVDPVSLDDAALNLAITGCARTEAATAGRRLALVAELVTRRLGSELARSRERRSPDGWDCCAAEISADLLIGHRKASGLMYQALDLRDRYALVGALLGRGDIALRVATQVSWRTQLIEDPALWAKVDADLAEAATRWGGYSDQKLSDAIDAIIERHDPDAVRRFRTAQKQLNIQYGKPDDATGTCSVFGRLDAASAAIGERRKEAMAKSVCPDDPRTQGERRAAAYGIIMAGGDHLPCECGKSDCPAPKGPDARGQLVEILILTDNPNPGDSGENDPPPTQPDDDGGDGGEPDVGPTYDPDDDWEQHWTDDPGPDEPADEDVEPPPDDEPEAESAAPAAASTPAAATPCAYTSILAGGGIIPAPLLADLVRMGASIRTVVKPEELTAEPRYRPSIAAQRFVWARDMTCRFPGCDHPAEYCDVDHTIAYGPGGLTHPGNTKTLCRKHHLLKTFWVGRGGWSDTQLPDGTIVWTSPSGLKHRAPPGSRIYFPNWDPTTPLPETPAVATEPVPGRDLRMPKRRRTRAQQRATSIKAERQRNRRAAEEANTAPF